MPLIRSQDFEGQSVGEAPEGWIVDPTGSATIQNDPETGSPNGKVVRMQHGTEFMGCTYTLPNNVSAGKVRLRCYMRGTVHGTESHYHFSVNAHSDSARVASLSMDSDGNWYYTDADSGFNLIGPYEDDCWYVVELHVDVDAGTYDVWIDGEREVAGASWENDEDHVHSACFYCSQTKTGHFDNVGISSQDNQADAPERICLATGYAGDGALTDSVRPDGSSPDRYNESFDDANVLCDSLNRPWRSQDISDGIHALDLDLGEAASPGLLAILGHNLADMVTGSFEMLLKAKASQSQSWSTPDFEIDLTANKEEPIVLAWIPRDTGYRYWRIHLHGSGISGIDSYRIGRVILTAFFTPAYNFEAAYRWGWEDPSVASRAEGGALIALEKPKYRAVRFSFRDMEIDDQETLLEMFHGSGRTATWLICFDPSEHPVDRSLYGNVEANRLEIDRGIGDLGDVSLKMKEIVR